VTTPIDISSLANAVTALGEAVARSTANQASNDPSVVTSVLKARDAARQVRTEVAALAAEARANGQRLDTSNLQAALAEVEHASDVNRPDLLVAAGHWAVTVANSWTASR